MSILDSEKTQYQRAALDARAALEEAVRDALERARSAEGAGFRYLSRGHGSYRDDLKALAEVKRLPHATAEMVAYRQRAVDAAEREWTGTATHVAQVLSYALAALQGDVVDMDELKIPLTRSERAYRPGPRGDRE